MAKNRNKGAKASNMAQKKKEEAKKVETPVVEKPVEEKKDEKVEKTTQQSNKPVEAPKDKPKEEAKPAPKVDPKKEEKSAKTEVKTEVKPDAKTEKPKTPETKSQKKEEKVIIPEVVETTHQSKKSASTAVSKNMSLSEMMSKVGNRERIDENSQVAFLNLLHKAYLDNPQATLTKEQREAYKEVFDGGMCQLSLVLAAQLEEEGKAMLGGINVTKEVYPLAKKNFLDMFGVDVHALPNKDNPEQLTIQFTDVPKDVKEAAKADAKAAPMNIPEPDSNMSEEDKLNVIRSILTRTNASEGAKGSTGGSRMGKNLFDAINWAKVAWGLTANEPAATLAFLYQKFNDKQTLCLTGFMKKAWGSTVGNFSPYITHAIIHKDFEDCGLSEQQVANMVKTMIAANGESEFPTEKDALIKRLAEINNMIEASSQPGVINNLITKSDAIPIKWEGGLEEHKMDGSKIYSVVNNIYKLQDSGKLIRDRFEEICNLYKSPIHRLAAYTDESAYSK